MPDDSVFSVKIGTHSIVKDGEIIKDLPSKLVYYNNLNDLIPHTSEFPAGTIAATYGFGTIMQLTDNGIWRSI